MNTSTLYLQQLSKTDGFSSEITKVSKQFQGVVDRILDLYRTAPFGIISGSTTIFSMAMLLVLFQEMDVYAILLFELLETYILGLSVNAIKEQFKLRKRLENILAKRGYSDRIFKVTLYEWCDVQTAKVATRKYGCLDKYLELSEKNKELRRM